MRIVFLSLALAATVSTARAHGPSEASVASSMLPLAVVALPSVALAGGAALTVVAVEASAAGTTWVLERAADGSRLSLQLAAGSVAASGLAVGAVLAVTVISTGWILSQAGRVVCFVPNQIGAALMHGERITR